eukprot:Pgem_evm1s5178
MVEQSLASQIIGYISTSIWIIVSIPQLYEMYKLKSSEGMAILFLLSWLLGDTLSLLGLFLSGQWTGSKTTVVTTIWFVLSDLLLIIFYCYYEYCYPKLYKKLRDSDNDNDETENDIEDRSECNEITPLVDTSEHADYYNNNNSSSNAYVNNSNNNNN